MFTTINAGRSFTILFNALILLILVIQPVPAQEETAEARQLELFRDQEYFGTTQLKSNGPGGFADSEEKIDQASIDLSSLAQITIPAYDTGYTVKLGSTLLQI